MADLIVETMTESEFAAFREGAVAGYAEAHVAAGNWAPEEAAERSERSFEELLPEGLATPGMLLLSASLPGKGVVGSLWIALTTPEDRGAWIYDIEIAAAHRGNGYGRALLTAAESEVRRHGIDALGLNVFGANHVARRLYESAGYEVTSVFMRKPLR